MRDKDLDHRRVGVGLNAEMQNRAGKAVQRDRDMRLLRIVAAGPQDHFVGKGGDPFGIAHQDVGPHGPGADDAVARMARRHQRGMGGVQPGLRQRFVQRLGRPEFLEPDHIRRQPAQRAARPFDLARVDVGIPAVAVGLDRLTRQLQVEKVERGERDVFSGHGSIRSGCNGIVETRARIAQRGGFVWPGRRVNGTKKAAPEGAALVSALAEPISSARRTR